jgi:hypothetical protein
LFPTAERERIWSGTMTAGSQTVHQAYLDGLKSIAEEAKSKIVSLVLHHEEKGV